MKITNVQINTLFDEVQRADALFTELKRMLDQLESKRVEYISDSFYDATDIIKTTLMDIAQTL